MENCGESREDVKILMEDSEDREDKTLQKFLMKSRLETIEGSSKKIDLVHISKKP